VKGLLVRVGVDQAFGGWNAPVDATSGHFAYVPIPEGENVEPHPGLGRPFTEAVEWVDAFAASNGCDVRFPPDLVDGLMHLDPDFAHLTYGDDGSRRGSRLVQFGTGDILAFYAGLRPVRQCEHRLLYALIGLYVVDEVVWARDVPRAKWCQNAHTRKVKRGEMDVVVRGRPGVSGRLERCIPIGELRSGAYRVRPDVLEAWGGLSVKDGYIQRSAVPPRFLDADLFYHWFQEQKIGLLPRNN
jgi:hypothetical protein